MWCDWESPRRSQFRAIRTADAERRGLLTVSDLADAKATGPTLPEPKTYEPSGGWASGGFQRSGSQSRNTSGDGCGSCASRCSRSCR